MSSRLKDTPKAIHEAYPVGMVWIIERKFMSAPENSLAVVYENYKLGEHHGVSIIAQNGSYDGFSEQCLEIFKVTPIRFESSLSGYQFNNVTQLCQHFEAGVFNAAFERQG